MRSEEAQTNCGTHLGILSLPATKDLPQSFCTYRSYRSYRSYKSYQIQSRETTPREGP